jgi:hypothetical protein
MSKVSLRRLLSRLAAIALSTSAPSASTAGAAAADPSREPPARADQIENDLEDSDGELDASLPIDPEQLEARDAAAALGRSLALALGELRPLTATHLAATWSLSDDPLRRLAVAHALEWTFPLVGDALVIDHLSRDTDPQVRAASARAAWARRPGGDPGVLARLSLDPDPEVREVATSGRPA